MSLFPPALGLLSSGLLSWAIPVFAQDPAGPSPCANGIAVPDPQDHPGLVADCEVLLTTGAELGLEMEWSAHTPITRWRGLEFGDSRVTGLSFPRGNLTGWLPPEWGQLTELETLNLAGNQSLTGPIPPEWGQLRKLRNLDLGGVNLIRSIPPELGRLTELESLSLTGITAYGGNLVGPIPPELGGLRKLKQLDLHDNHLSGPIPPELGQLTELVWLKLSRNELTGPIPPGLGQLTQLAQLHLHTNQLTGPIPPELGQLSRLDWLRLQDNELTGPIPPELGRLTRLRGLQLEGNRLTGPIPPELGELTALVWLKLSGNRLTGPIPPELGQLTRLRELNLSHNRLTGAVPPELARLARLSSWHLAGNQLTCVPGAVARLVDDLDVPVCGRPGTLVESPHVLHGLPAASGLEPGFPNPFNAGTRIPYRLAAPGPVRMQIFNLLGQPVRTLVDEFHEAGEYQVHWDARDQRGAVVGAGLYFTRLHHPGGVETRRLLVLR